MNPIPQSKWRWLCDTHNYLGEKKPHPPQMPKGLSTNPSIKIGAEKKRKKRKRKKKRKTTEKRKRKTKKKKKKKKEKKRKKKKKNNKKEKKRKKNHKKEKKKTKKKQQKRNMLSKIAIFMLLISVWLAGMCEWALGGSWLLFFSFF